MELGSWAPLRGWGPGRKSLIIGSGSDVSHHILSSFLRLWLEGYAALRGLGLKHNQGQDVIFNLTETVPLISGPEAFFLRPLDSDQNLMS